MSIVTSAVLSYILPKIDGAERVLLDAQQASAPRQDYIGFEFSLQVVRKCKQAVSTEPTHDSAVSLKLLETAMDALKTVGEGDAALPAQRAGALIEQAAVILRAPK
jgi:hypothetical protein